VTRSYSSERAVFKALREALGKDQELRTDIETAFRVLVSRYSTSIPENRFIVGGIVECFFVSMFRAIGMKSEDVAAREKGVDIRVEGISLSIKSSFAKKRPPVVHLINRRGESEAVEWEYATIFVYARQGIGYADPALLPGAAKKEGDAIKIASQDVLDLWARDPQWCVAVSVPDSGSAAEVDNIESKQIADRILSEGMKRLRPLAASGLADSPPASPPPAHP